MTTQSKLPLSSPAEVLPAAVEEKTTATIKCKLFIFFTTEIASTPSVLFIYMF